MRGIGWWRFLPPAGQNQVNRAKTSIVQSIGAIADSTESRLHYTRRSIVQHVLCSEIVHDGKPLYCKTLADLRSSPSSRLRIDACVVSGDGAQLQTCIATNILYPAVAKRQRNGGVATPHCTLSIGIVLLLLIITQEAATPTQSTAGVT
jgi:hypothetical protein